jgi:ABC-type sugar transport system ATPase subunit
LSATLLMRDGSETSDMSGGVRMRSISKRFGATQALSKVDVDLAPNEVHALVGENGAGKSTLMRVLAGAFSQYEGSITLGGAEVSLTSPALARRLGVSLVHQELSLLPELSVGENILLGREPRARIPGFISPRNTNAVAGAHLSACGVAIEPHVKVARLSLAQRQLVEIVKGVAGSPRVLILDEPTSSLTVRETEYLFRIIRRLIERRTAIVYISHKLDEVFAIADRITVLRDGVRVASAPTSEWSESQLIRAMVGRDLAALFPRTPQTPGPTRLSVADLTKKPMFHDVSFEVNAGEILGLYGIVGAGRTNIAEALFGLAPADAGSIRINGTPITIRSPSQAIAAGVGMVPEDRRRQGLTPMLSVRSNVSIAALKPVSTAGFIHQQVERQKVSKYLKQLVVRSASQQQEVSTLSGGNQQKVVISRSLMPEPKILVLDEPTRGIDVVAKAEVHGSIDRLVQQGMAVILISSELPEILGMSDRILVIREGTVVGEFKRSEASEEKLVALATGARQ